MNKLILIFVAAITLVLTSCSFPTASGYFEYSYWYDEKIQIVGLTASGKEQEYLIIPEELDGKVVGSLGASGWFQGGQFESEVLKRVYILGDTDIGNGWFFSETSNLTHILVVRNNNSHVRYAGFAINVHITYLSKFLHNQEPFITGTNFLIANLSYNYNYQDSPNEGYYFIDDYDGEMIQFIPPDPVRLGYTFDGWYKEVECINLWDFDVDIVPEKTEEYLETMLYAKWV